MYVHCTQIAYMHKVDSAFRKNTNHTLPCDSVMTVDTYRRLDNYFTREGTKRKRKGRFEEIDAKIMRVKYTLH